MNPILIILRIIMPPVILKYPLIGGAIAIFLDNLDWHTKNLAGIPPVGDYQVIDKYLDMYYLTLLFIVGLRFMNALIKNTIKILFVLRLIGFILFEITQIRLILFFFPNIFENFFFFYFIMKTVSRFEPEISKKLLFLMLILVTIPKILHEYSIHVIQKPLVIELAGLDLAYQGTLHQAIYIIIISILFGLYFRKQKNKHK